MVICQTLILKVLFLIICFLVLYKQIVGLFGSVSCSLMLSGTMSQCSHDLRSCFQGDSKVAAQEINRGMLRSQLQKFSELHLVPETDRQELPQHEVGHSLHAGHHPRLLPNQ